MQKQHQAAMFKPLVIFFLAWLRIEAAPISGFRYDFFECGVGTPVFVQLVAVLYPIGQPTVVAASGPKPINECV